MMCKLVHQPEARQMRVRDSVPSSQPEHACLFGGSMEAKISTFTNELTADQGNAGPVSLFYQTKTSLALDAGD